MARAARSSLLTITMLPTRSGGPEMRSQEQLVDTGAKLDGDCPEGRGLSEMVPRVVLDRIVRGFGKRRSGDDARAGYYEEHDGWAEINPAPFGDCLRISGWTEKKVLPCTKQTLVCLRGAAWKKSSRNGAGGGHGAAVIVECGCEGKRCVRFQWLQLRRN